MVHQVRCWHLFQLPVNHLEKNVVCRYESPISKKLENLCKTELSLQITDETGTVLNNHGLPIIIELLIK